MRQLEIEYFFPLTEQISLDLDFKPCQQFEEEKRKALMAASVVSCGQYLLSGGTGLTTWSSPNSTISFKPEDDSVGYWELGKGFHFYNKKKPNWLNRKMVALILGLKWNDK